MDRLFMKINLDDVDFERYSEVKVIAKDSSTELGQVMYEAYKGTIDYDDETVEQAIDEMRGTLNGKYGKLIKDASVYIENNGAIASAIIYCFFEEESMPLLTFSMTRASEKGKGHAKRLIKESLMRLKELGYSLCCLYVTKGNEPAISIYKTIGFNEN